MNDGSETVRRDVRWPSRAAQSQQLDIIHADTVRSVLVHFFLPHSRAEVN